MPVLIEASDIASLINIYGNARVNRNICRMHLTKFHDIGVENVTNLYWFAGILMKDVGSDKYPQPFANLQNKLSLCPWTRVRVNPRSLFITYGLVQHKRRLYTLYITIYMAKAAVERLHSKMFDQNQIQQH